MARFRRRRLEIVSATIDVHDGKRGEFGIRNALQTAHDYGDELFAIRSAAASEGLDAAVLAEQMMDAPGAELIVAERVCTAQQPEILTIEGGQPGSRLAANRAIALQRAQAQIHVRFIANRPAVTAAPISLLYEVLAAGTLHRRMSAQQTDKWIAGNRHSGSIVPLDLSILPSASEWLRPRVCDREGEDSDSESLPWNGQFRVFTESRNHRA
jgi:hypothetical protein